MKRILYILSFSILVLAMSSCAKEEIEAPSESNEGPKSLVIDNTEYKGDEIIFKTGNSQARFIDDSDGDGEIFINDDGDDEDEERGPTK